nr:RVP_2 domain-containing protein [Tanacetum cinerariifolium]
DNSPRINRNAEYENQRIDNVAGARENVEVSPDAADSGPIFNDEPLQKVSTDDHYKVFAMESTHPEQSKSDHDTYPIEQDAQNVIIDSLDMGNDRGEIDQNDDDNDLAKEQMKDKLSAHQETISILSKQKEAQIKLYKTREDKELDKVIELENKVKVLDNIVYKTDQSVQMMNMLNNKCQTSFAKPEFLKKAQRANPRLYDIGFYNDNLALMLAPDTDEVIRLEKESRSKLSDLIRPFDYDKLNNLCLNEEMVADLRYFNSLESELDSLRSQLETQKTQFLNEIDRLSREYYYADHMNAILEKIDIVLSWPSEEAPPVIKGSLDADEDIGIVEVSSAIDDVFDIGESNVESMEVRIEFSEVLENKESVEEVVGGGEALEIGEDDDLGDATTDGGDDAVESGDISILNSLIGHGSPRSLQRWEKISTGDVHVLIDKGSTHNFIRPDVFEKLCLPTYFTKVFMVYIGRGETLLYEYMCAHVAIEIQDLRRKVDLYMLRMKGMWRRQQQQIATNAKIQRRL